MFLMCPVVAFSLCVRLLCVCDVQKVNSIKTTRMWTGQQWLAGNVDKQPSLVYCRHRGLFHSYHLIYPRVIPLSFDIHIRVIPLTFDISIGDA